LTFIKVTNKIIGVFFFTLFSIPIIFLILGSLGYSINDQAYFYTLSTISQTLGAILGISVIFLTFNLQNLESRKNEYLNQLMELIPLDDPDCKTNLPSVYFSSFYYDNTINYYLHFIIL
jgi:hypothetical protein